MLHPLLSDDNDFKNMSMEDIQKKITELNKRLMYVSNFQVANQLRMILDEYYALSNEKLRAEMDKQEKDRQAKIEKAKKDLDI